MKTSSLLAGVGSDGRKYYKASAIEAAVNDIASGRATVAELAERLGTHKTTIANWLKKNNVKPPKKTPSAPANGAAKSLLEQALEVQGSPEAAAIEVTNEHIDLAAAFVAGRVNASTVKQVLRKDSDSKFITTVWLGHCFAAAVRCGRIK